MLEGPVVLEVDLDDLDGQFPEDRRDQLARHAVGGIHGNPEPAETGMEEPQDMLLVVRGQVRGLDRSGHLAPRVQEGQGQVADIRQARVHPDRHSPLAADLEAVVPGGVVGSRDLDPAAAVQVVDREVDLGRVDHADVDHPNPRGADALDQGLGQGRAVLAHVVAHADPLSVGLAAIESPNQGG